MAEYIVEIRNVFEADSPEEAVGQMATYLVDNAYQAGYRVYSEDENDIRGTFIDADDVDWDGVNSDAL